MGGVAAGLMGILLLAAGCADPFIESTTVLGDTTDFDGPYVVESIAVGTRSGDRVEVRHSRPERQDGVIGMLALDDDGDGPGDLFRAEIPGQPTGSEISYYVILVRDEIVVDRDPAGEGEDAPRFVFSISP